MSNSSRHDEYMGRLHLGKTNYKSISITNVCDYLKILGVYLYVCKQAIQFRERRMLLHRSHVPINREPDKYFKSVTVFMSSKMAVSNFLYGLSG